MDNKTCSQCKETKPVTEFYKCSHSKDGLAAACKKCYRIQQKKYRETHPEQVSECKKRWYREHTEHVKKRVKKWKIENKERKRLTDKKYKQSPNGVAAQLRDHYKRKKKDKNPTLTAEQWQKILENQNYRCNICNRKFTNKLTPVRDHIIPLAEEGCLTFENTQALCKFCNGSKNKYLDPSCIITWLVKPDKMTNKKD